MRAALAKFCREYLFKNAALKIVALGLATLLWLAVGHDQNIEMLVTVPLELQHAPPNLEVDSESPFQARVTLSGPERLLQQMNTSEVHAVLNVAGASAGEHTFDLSGKDIHAPREVKVVQVVPAQFHINFAPSVSRTVEVEPRVMGTLLAGYGIDSVSAEPSAIVITGPANRVNAIDNAITDPVDATGVVGKATFATHAYVADPLVHVQTPEPIHVTVVTGKTTSREGKR
jgi:YbbR domain-containing protein